MERVKRKVRRTLSNVPTLCEFDALEVSHYFERVERLAAGTKADTRRKKDFR